MEKLKFLARADLATRWEMTRQGVHQRAESDPNFPKPYDVIQNGRLPIYLLSEIEAYEGNHPELLNPDFRYRKILWNYYNVINP